MIERPPFWLSRYERKREPERKTFTKPTNPYGLSGEEWALVEAFRKANDKVRGFVRYLFKL